MKYLISLMLLGLVACGGGSSVEEPDPITPDPVDFVMPTAFEYEYDGYSGVGVRVDDIVYFTPSVISNSDRTVTAKLIILSSDDDGNMTIKFNAYNFATWYKQEITSYDLVRSGDNWEDSSGIFKLSSIDGPKSLSGDTHWKLSSWSGQFGEQVLDIDSSLNGSDSRGCDVSGEHIDYALELAFVNCAESGAYSGAIFEISGKVRGVAILNGVAVGLYYDIVDS